VGTRNIIVEAHCEQLAAAIREQAIIQFGVLAVRSRSAIGIIEVKPENDYI
jgi:hypothetical protein